MKRAAIDQPQLGTLLCGEGVQYAIVPGWVAELPFSVLPPEAFRIYSLYCTHANCDDGMVWLRRLRLTARDYLGCSERAQRKWEKQLEGLGLISKVGRFGIRVHRRRDEIEELRSQNAARALNANRHGRAGSPAAGKSSQPARPCRSENANRHGGAAEPARACRHIQRSEITTSEFDARGKNPDSGVSSQAQEVQSNLLGKMTGEEREQILTGFDKLKGLIKQGIG